MDNGRTLEIPEGLEDLWKRMEESTATSGL
jgi:hypothetical protein